MLTLIILTGTNLAKFSFDFTNNNAPKPGRWIGHHRGMLGKTSIFSFISRNVLIQPDFQ